ncbi:MAG: carboxymuconolactone decarboxylase family protein [Rhizobiaceae bacterium]|nr:carboxymuconolactone decarboxylase family protein [Hyphomicrobiales bacterium]NRB31277.1 carboxymuconolactone decarboxylase family protein [Rhizobiaceae bacterium]
MARIAPLDPDNLTDEQQPVYDAIRSGPRGAVVGPLAVWLNRPALADKAQKLGQYCRYDSSLEPRLSELAILVTARVWDATFEWQSHEPPARAAGLADSIIEALRRDEEPEFDKADEAVVYEVSRTLNMERGISQDLYDRAESLLGKDGLVDLIGVLGYYALISMTIKAFDVDPISDD